MKYRRRRRLLWVTSGLALVAALLGYAFWIEPYRIEVTRHEVEADVRTSLTIAHVTDLHTKGFGRREWKLVELLERERPDCIVVTGDCPVEGASPEAPAETLSKLHAPLGVIVVRGNWEIWKPLQHEDEFYRAAGTIFLLNQARRLREDLWVVGFDDEMAGKPDLSALKAVPHGTTALALFHSPSFFDQVAGQVPLALAGHTHGGQITLPFIGPLWIPRGSGSYVKGWYKKNGSRLFVSRGIGTSIVHARFLCRPELAILTVRPKSSKP